MRGRNSTTNESRVLRFLSGCSTRLRARAHKQGPEPGLAGDRLAAFRIVSDRRARIRLIKSQSASTVSEPALKWRGEACGLSMALHARAAGRAAVVADGH
jgi:hypothetical protein